MKNPNKAPKVLGSLPNALPLIDNIGSAGGSSTTSELLPVTYLRRIRDHC
jgi:hypothetical protein